MIPDPKKDADVDIAKSVLRVAWVFCFIISAIILVGLLLHCAKYLTAFIPLDDGEGFVLNQAKYLAEGHNPYHPIDQPPYMVTNYPPLFISILAILVRLFGLHLNLGRILSFISGLFILWLVFLSSGNGSRTKPGIRNFIGLAVLAATPVIYFWMPLARVDIFANMLSLAAIFTAWRIRSRKGCLISIVLLWLALFTRQSAIEGFVVIGLFLYTRRSRDLIWFISVYIIGTALIFVLLQSIFGPEFFRHIIIYTKTRWFPDRLVGTFQVIFKGMLLPTMVAAYAAWSMRKDEESRVWIFYFIAGFLLAFLSGKVGSDQNYFLPMFIPQAIVIGRWVSSEYSSKVHPVRFKAGIIAIVTVMIAYMGFGIGDRQLSFEPDAASLNNGKQLLKIIGSFKGPVLIEDEGLTLLAGRDVIYTPFIMNELLKEGLWDQSGFLAMLNDEEFDLIVLRFNVFDPEHEDVQALGDEAGWDRFSPEMEQAIREHYVTDGVPLYVRRPWYFYTRKSEGPPKIRLIYKD